MTQPADPRAPFTLTVAGLPAPQRLDAWLRRAQPGWGRQAVDRLIAARHVRVNDRLVWLSSWQVNNGDTVTITEPPQPRVEPGSPDHFDDAWLIHADADLVVVNKPAGLLAEAPPYRPDAPNLHSLAQARFGPLTLFHRLDRDTSGVLILTRTRAANRRLAAAWQARGGTGHAISKEYVAVVRSPNQLAAQGAITLRLHADPHHRERMLVVTTGGDHAVTRYQLIAPLPHPSGPPLPGEDAPSGSARPVPPASLSDRQWVRLWPITGRTHQLRVHLAALGAPILGDRLYGDIDAAPRLLLHAARLILPPWDDRPALTFTAPIPEEFAWPPEDA